MLKEIDLIENIILIFIYINVGLALFALSLESNKVMRIIILLMFFPIFYSYYFVFTGLFALRDSMNIIEVYTDKDTGIISFTKEYINGEL